MGQIGSAMGNKNTFAPDPEGFSGSEWATRIGGGAAKGLMQGYSNMQGQNQQMRQGGGAPPVNVAPFMQPDASGNSLIPQGQTGDVYQQPMSGGGAPGAAQGMSAASNLKKRNLAFFGG